MLGIGEILPPDASDRRAFADPLAREDLPHEPAVSPGLIQQGERLEPLVPQLARHVQWADRQIPLALIAHDQQRVPATGDHQHRFFEARIEPRKPGQIGKVLPVAINNQVRQSQLVHARPAPPRSETRTLPRALVSAARPRRTQATRSRSTDAFWSFSYLPFSKAKIITWPPGQDKQRSRWIRGEARGPNGRQFLASHPNLFGPALLRYLCLGPLPNCKRAAITKAASVVFVQRAADGGRHKTADGQRPGGQSQPFPRAPG